jgi:DNA-directed RNA polymerase specialized sigma24 family protein
MGSESSGMVDTSTSPDAVPDRMTMQAALMAVPIQRRESLVLHHVEGLKYKEIAGIVDATEVAGKRVASGSKEFPSAYRRLPGDEQE